MKLAILREKYPKFVYQNYNWMFNNNVLEIFFYFKIDHDIEFNPSLKIDFQNNRSVNNDMKSVLDNLVFNLGLIELLSYWKTVCSPTILIKSGYLSKEQIKWWKDLICKGMAQFFFENKINFTANG